MIRRASINYPRSGFKLIRDLFVFTAVIFRRFDVVFFSDSELTRSVVHSTLINLSSTNRSIAHFSVSQHEATSNVVTYTVSRRFLMWFMKWVKTSIFVSATSGIPRKWMPRVAAYRVHMPHSFVSLHMAYPKDAFDGFNVMFAIGPHHRREILGLRSRAPELPKCTVFNVGYGRMDWLKEDAKNRDVVVGPAKRIIVAPSWGDHNILSVVGLRLLEQLIGVGYRVDVRPHPGFQRTEPHLIAKLAEMAAGCERLALQSAQADAFFPDNFDLMISDYSGAAYEFAFFTKRPVVFVDVPKKIRNVDFESFGLNAMEIQAREQFGVVCRLDVADILSACKAELDAQRGRSTTPEARAQYCYNLGSAGDVAAEAVESLLQNPVH